MHLTRRAAGLLALGSGLGAVAACGGATKAGPPPQGVERSAYGDDPDQQVGDLYRPDGTTRGAVVLVHGGYWQSAYGLDLMRPMADDLVGRGWTVWNLEYRRLGSGGGWPATFTDVAAGIDHLAQVEGVDTDRLLAIGHSAGAQLAVWAASRTAATPGGEPRVPLAGVVSLAGVLDLTGGAEQGVGNGAITDLMGGGPDDVADHYRLGDPTLLVPAGCPVSMLRGTDDTLVPRAQSTAYLQAAEAADAEVSLQEVSGDHFTIIDPDDRTWAQVRSALDRLAD